MTTSYFQLNATQKPAISPIVVGSQKTRRGETESVRRYRLESATDRLNSRYRADTDGK